MRTIYNGQLRILLFRSVKLPPTEMYDTLDTRDYLLIEHRFRLALYFLKKKGESVEIFKISFIVLLHE